MRIGERTLQDGSIAPITVSVADDTLSLRIGDQLLGELPLQTLFVVMDRYAKSLDGSVQVPAGLDLGGGASLSMLRHLARYDVIARDWLVLARPGREPIAELAVSILAALEHLAHVTGRNTEA
jgi:hypothetical protein